MLYLCCYFQTFEGSNMAEVATFKVATLLKLLLAILYLCCYFQMFEVATWLKLLHSK